MSHPFRPLLLLAMLALTTTAAAAEATEAAAVVQADRGIRGSVIQEGTREPVPFAQITLRTVPSIKAVAAVSALAAAQGVADADAERSLEQLLALPPELLRAFIDSARFDGVPPENLAVLLQEQSTRTTRPGFPMRATADAAGHFAFANVPPGSYALTVLRDGFFAVSTGGTARPADTASATVTVTAQGAAQELSIAMIAGAVITGRVRDSSGNLLTHANVQAAVRALPGDTPGPPASLQAVSAKTDDRGEYRFYWLRPGEYVVSATAPPLQPGSANIVLAAAVYARTFYSDTIEVEGAATLTAHPGEELSDIDIALRLAVGGAPRTGAGEKRTGVKVSGVIVNALQTVRRSDGTTPPNTATLLLAPRGVPYSTAPAGARIVGAVALTAAGARFDIEGIQPGAYDLYARISDSAASRGRGPGGGIYGWGRAAIEVADGNLEGVTLAVHAAVEMDGRVLVDGEAPSSDRRSGIRVFLESTDSSAYISSYQGANFAPQSPKADGSFAIPGVAEASYAVEIYGLRPTEYVADMLQGGASIYDSGVHVGAQSPEPLEIRVATDGGAVNGIVTAAAGTSVARVRVLLAPSSDHRRNGALYKTAITDAQGRFSIQGIRPDDYKLFAWESPPAGVYANAELAAHSESPGIAVTVAPSAAFPVQVPLIPATAPPQKN